MPFSEFEPGFGANNTADLEGRQKQFLQELNQAYRRATVDSPIGSHDLPDVLKPNEILALLAVDEKADPASPASWSGIALAGAHVKVKNAYQLAVNQWVFDKSADVGTAQIEKARDRLYKKLDPALKAVAPKAPAAIDAGGRQKGSALDGFATGFSSEPEREDSPLAAAVKSTPQAAEAPVAPAKADPPKPAVQPAPVQSTAAPEEPKTTPATQPAMPTAPAPEPPPAVSQEPAQMPPPPVIELSQEERSMAEATRMIQESGFNVDRFVDKANIDLDKVLLQAEGDIERAAERAAEVLAAAAPYPYKEDPALEEPTEKQLEAMQKFEDAQDEVQSHIFGTIEDGSAPDAELDAEFGPEDYETKYARLGIPPRPRLWPRVMKWPPHADVRALENPNLTDQQRKLYIDMMIARVPGYLTRADQIHKYILENQERSPFNSRRDKRFVEQNKHEPHHGITWAALLDSDATRKAQSLVASWSHDSATTVDGGFVRVSADGKISLRPSVTSRLAKKPTEQSIELALREGLARGWDSFKCRGTPEFAAIVAKKAKELGVAAEITVIGIPVRKIRVMEPPPPFQNIPAKPENNGPEKNDPAGNAPEASNTPSEGPAADPFKEPKGKNKKNVIGDNLDVSAM